MDTHLVAVRPFAGLARGDVVVDAARIKEILSSENAINVVRVCTPDATAAAAQTGQKEG